MSKIDRCFVRNQGYTRAKISNIERHNERKNQHYSNSDVDLSRADLNVHFKKCNDTYLATFDKMVEDGAISTWNLKKDPKIIDEFIFDVNTEYFDRHGAGSPDGGYEYAKRFYEEAYRFAVAEAGGEEFILSAVMHADERNKALSEQLGRDVYHYHLHVMYIPVVDTEIKWTKRCKDPELIGKVKCVVKQISNSKKWKSDMVVGEDGKKHIAYSYSAMQDRFHQHMNGAGYTDVERGERGSNAEHLSVLDFKIKQDTKRVAELEQDVQAKQKQSETLNKRLAVKQNAAANYLDIDKMARRGKTGKMILEPEDWEAVSSMAKTGVLAKVNADEMKKHLDLTMERLGKEKTAYDRLHEQVRPYLDAVRVAPGQTQAALENIHQQHREHQQKRQRSSSLER